MAACICFACWCNCAVVSVKEHSSPGMLRMSPPASSPASAHVRSAADSQEGAEQAAGDVVDHCWVTSAEGYGQMNVFTRKLNSSGI